MCPVARGTHGLSAGAETARVMANAGARVIMTSRDIAAGEAAAAKIRQQGAKVRLHVPVTPMPHRQGPPDSPSLQYWLLQIPTYTLFKPAQ